MLRKQHLGFFVFSPKLDRSNIHDGNVPVNPFAPISTDFNLVRPTSDDGRVETREFPKRLMCSVHHGQEHDSPQQFDNVVYLMRSVAQCLWAHGRSMRWNHN